MRFHDKLHLVTLSQSCLLPLCIMTTFGPLQVFKSWSPSLSFLSGSIDLDMELKWSLGGVVFVALLVTSKWTTQKRK